VIHYCVTNMPGAVPRTSTFALTNATLPYVKAIADHGWSQALAKDAGLSNGLNVHDGRLTHHAVASALGIGDRVTFHGRIPIDAVPAAIASGKAEQEHVSQSENHDRLVRTR